MGPAAARGTHGRAASRVRRRRARRGPGHGVLAGAGGHERAARTHRAAATAVLAAFAEPGATERDFTLPELGASFPGRTAIGFHFIDYVVHAWDVAATLGTELDLSDDVLDIALVVARLVPTEPAVRGPEFAFAPPLDVPPEAGPLDETLRLLGRTPEQWPVKGR